MIYLTFFSFLQEYRLQCRLYVITKYHSLFVRSPLFKIFDAEVMINGEDFTRKRERFKWRHKFCTMQR